MSDTIVAAIVGGLVGGAVAFSFGWFTGYSWGRKYMERYIKYSGISLNEPKPQTNADRIRGMSDYEMAEWLADILNHCDAKPPTADCLESCPLYKCCNDQPSDNIEAWLKSPADKEGDT